MVDVTSITRVELREVWPNEARDFTPWLADHLVGLGEALGMELELVEIEGSVGSFSVDLVATETSTNRQVVIENQLEQTNHDHLGKVLTYAAGYNADVMVWIAQEIREEHRQALDWLNQRTDSNTEFYGVVVELLKIDESRPAYNFEVVARPNQWRKSKVVTSGSRYTSTRQEAYRTFFQSLIDRLRTQHQFTNARVGQPQGWYSFPSGRSGIGYGASFAQGGRVRADLYIDTGSLEENKRLYDALLNDKEPIEQAFGEPLSWERLDERRASRVGIYRAGSIDDSEEELKSIEEWLVERLLRFKSVLGPKLPQINRRGGDQRGVTELIAE